MKIGILTFHSAVNYGAVLQCWALAEKLKSMGFEVFIINYVSSFIKEKYSPFSWTFLSEKSLMGKVQYLMLHFFKRGKIIARNEKFSTFINACFRYVSLDLIDEKMDIVLVGSDQVWNTELTGGYDKHYFLDFPIKSQIKRISFAASSELVHFQRTINGNNKAIMALSKFHALSVREEALKNELLSKGLKDVVVVSDPTLLLDIEHYEKVVAEKIVDEKDLFVFQVVNSPLTMKVAQKMAKSKNLKLVYLNASYRLFQKDKNVSIPIGPSEFLSLIKYSDFIITTSFHGTAFSIIYRKQFVTIRTAHMNRQENLLYMLGLSNRIISDISEVSILEDIEYGDAFKTHFEKYRCGSNLFLKRILNHDFE